jgi:ribosomal-protein-alanine N-acetyltransferase
MTLATGDDRIESERLVLRRITAADAPFFTRIHADPEVARYIGPGRPRTVDESRQWIELVLSTYESMQLGQLAVIRKADGALIGRCGIAFLAIDSSPPDGGEPLGYFVPEEAPIGRPTRTERELGYTFDRSAWGQGYAREAAGAVFNYAKSVLRADRIVSLIDSDNIRSKAVARAFGATLVERVRALDRSLELYSWPI